MSSVCDIEYLKSVASSTIDACNDELYHLSSEIWRNPEIGFEEYKAHEMLTNLLEKKGFTVERCYTGIDTSFRATFGTGKPNVCVICEYDALPEIGHACGHNLIAEAGVAAGLGVKAALESGSALRGRVTVMGTPSEETLGGKICLLSNGAFDDVDVAMMVHPAPYSILKTQFVACLEWKITFVAKKSQQLGASPMNALDAAVMAYHSVSLLRQQLKPDAHSIHGIITDGGIDPSIIPEEAELQYFIRAPTKRQILGLAEKVRSCFEAVASATGCKVVIKESPPCDDLQSNEVLAQCYLKNYRAFERDMIDKYKEIGSTDMGNVSYAVPSIHPMFKIGTGEVYHTRDFTSITNSAESHAETLMAAKAMAHTCVEVISDEGLLDKAKREFENIQTL